MRKLLLLIVLLYSIVFHSYPQQIRFTQLGLKDGLSQSTINTILQDKFGQIWIGTQDGLNVYNGYTFSVYYHQSKDSSSIVGNFVNDLCEDEYGNIWIATDRGLSVYSPETRNFTSYKHKKDDANSIVSNNINDVFIDSRKQVWIASADNGVSVMNLISGEVKNFPFVKNQNNTISHPEIKSIQEDQYGNMWFATNGAGVSCYETEKKVWHSFKQDYFSSEGLPSNQINKLVLIGEKIWAATGDGIATISDYELIKEAKIIRQKNPANKPSQVNTIFHDLNGNIWFGTEGDGLFVNKSSKTERYKNNPFLASSISSDIVKTIYQDRSGLMWVGTFSGLSKFDPYKQGFSHYHHIPYDPNSLSDNTIWAILEDPVDERFVWIGNMEGLNRFNKTTGEFVNFKEISSNELYRKNTNVYSLAFDAFNDILIGTNSGIYRAKINEERTPSSYQRFNYCEVFNEKTENRVYEMLNDEYGNLWIGTKQGLVRYNWKVGNGRVFTTENGLCNNTVRSLYIDSDNTLWLSTDGGLGKVSLPASEEPAFHCYLNDFNDNTSISNNQLLSVIEDKEKRLWVGTYGGGLNVLDKKTGKFKAYTEQNGLPNNVVYGLLNDDYGNFWISTNKGLSRFNVGSETFQNYHEYDGLQSDEFNIGAFHRGKKGIMYFGGINGFNYFKPEDITINPNVPEILITDLKVFNKSTGKVNDFVLEKHISVTHELELNHKQNNFSFELSAFHFSNPTKNQYAWKMVGFDEDWNYAGNNRVAQYTNLDPGDYTFIAKAANSDGVWSDKVATITITIDPPIYKRWWFLISVLALVLLSVRAAIKVRIKVIEDQKQELESLVVERTREVTEQKEKIEQQKSLLEVEKDKVDKLLLNILPQETVDELKLRGKASARSYRTATVMFTDFKNFTRISERLRPQEIVQKLDTYFVAFDNIIEKHNMEKIKTIGDAYMCAGGIPIRNKSNPIDVVLAGLKIQYYIRQLKKHNQEHGLPEDDVWDLRLGIHTGELIAGVVGTKRFAYDIWGDTVNVANRMEQSGEAGRVNVSGVTYDYIKEFFECTYRGKVSAKNKGEVDMYFVERIIPELSADAEGIEPNDVFWDYVDLKLYSSINYQKAEKYIVKLLEDGLSPNLTYHNIRHTKDVCYAAERIGKSEGIKGEPLFLLKTAALCHDAGFVKEYANNEEYGAEIARECLPHYGYSDEQIKLVVELIMATKVPQKPKNKLEEIICDADLDYLGRDDFAEIGDGLKKEFMAYGIIKDDRHWDEVQVKFLSSHNFFTETNKRTRNPKKFQHLEVVKKRLEEGKY